MKIDVSLETLATALAALHMLKNHFPAPDRMNELAISAITDIKRAANVIEQFEKECA